MYIDDRIEDALDNGAAKVDVLLTCSGHLSRVEQALNESGVNVTGSVPEFLIIHASIDREQLDQIMQIKGIGSVELNEDA